MKTGGRGNKMGKRGKGGAKRMEGREGIRTRDHSFTHETPDHHLATHPPSSLRLDLATTTSPPFPLSRTGHDARRVCFCQASARGWGLAGAGKHRPQATTQPPPLPPFLPPCLLPRLPLPPVGDVVDGDLAVDMTGRGGRECRVHIGDRRGRKEFLYCK